MPIHHRATANLLLSSLHGVTLDRLMPHLTLIEMTAGDTVYESCAEPPFVYFPVTATVSLSYVGINGALAEISIVGNDGIIGIPLLLNGKVSPCRGVVRTAGSAYRMVGSVLAGEFNRPGPALRIFLAYARALTAQMEQTAACDVQSPAERKLCSRCGDASACPRADQPSGMLT
jgi:hypothetical protein